MRGKAERSGSGGGMVRKAELSKRKAAQRWLHVCSELPDGWGRDQILENNKG